MPDNVVRGQVGIEGIAKAKEDVRSLKADVESLNKVSANTEIKVDTSPAQRSLTQLGGDIKRILAESKQGVQASAADIQTIRQYVTEMESTLSSGMARRQSEFRAGQKAARETIATLKEIEQAANQATVAVAAANAELGKSAVAQESFAARLARDQEARRQAAAAQVATMTPEQRQMLERGISPSNAPLAPTAPLRPTPVAIPSTSSSEAWVMAESKRIANERQAAASAFNVATGPAAAIGDTTVDEPIKQTRAVQRANAKAQREADTQARKEQFAAERQAAAERLQATNEVAAAKRAELGAEQAALRDAEAADAVRKRMEQLSTESYLQRTPGMGLASKFIASSDRLTINNAIAQGYTPRPPEETSPWFRRQPAVPDTKPPATAKSPLNVTRAEREAADNELRRIKAEQMARREADSLLTSQAYNRARQQQAEGAKAQLTAQNIPIPPAIEETTSQAGTLTSIISDRAKLREAIEAQVAQAKATAPPASSTGFREFFAGGVPPSPTTGAVNAQRNEAVDQVRGYLQANPDATASEVSSALGRSMPWTVMAMEEVGHPTAIPKGTLPFAPSAQKPADASFMQQQAQSLATNTAEQSRIRNSQAAALQRQVEKDAESTIDLGMGGRYGGGGTGTGGGGGSRGSGGSRGRTRSNTFSTRLSAVDTEDALGSMQELQRATAAFRGEGGRIVISAALKDGPKTISEVQALSQAMSELVGKTGRGTINLAARSQEEAGQVAQMLSGAMGSVKSQNVAFNLSTVPDEDRSLSEDRAAQRLRDAEQRRIQQQARNVGQFQVRMQRQQFAEEAAGAKEAEKALADLDKAEQKRMQSMIQPFSSAAQSHSRGILGVPLGLAAPAALGLGVGVLGSQAAGYETLTTTTANQTTMSPSDLNIMDRTIRNLPSGSPDLNQLAMGFKNITDLGYSAAQSQQIATEESKAATAAGADQASVMLAITSSMKDYNAEAADVSKFTNTTAEAAKLANSTFETWSDTTRRATAIAAAYHVPLREVDAALVALTRHGFNTSQANTQVAGLIQNIVAPTPAAMGSIKDLSLKTGIDLQGDFSQQGLNTKGLQGVLSDLGKATEGDESLIRRLIPALRGGQAALLLTTTATDDFNYALGKLGETADGSLKPVEEGFARMQQTAGYKLGQALKDLKFDAIDIGSAFLPPLNAILGAFEAIPDPIRKTTVEAVALGLVAKTLQVGLQFVTVGAENLAKNIALEAAATQADTAILAENTAALTARGIASKAAALGGGPGTGVLAIEGAAVEVGAAGKIAATVAKWASTLAAFAIPITLSLVAGKILSDITVGTFLNHLYDNKANNNQDVMDGDQFAKNVLGAPDAATASRLGKNYIDTIDEEIAAYQKQKKANEGLGFHGGPLQGIANAIGLNKDDEINHTINDLVDREKGIQDAVDQRTKGISATDRVQPDDIPDPTELSSQEQQDIASHYLLVQDEVAKLRRQGVPERLINLTQFPEDFSVSPDVLARAKHDLAEWQRQYQDVQDKAKAGQQALSQIDLSKGVQGLVSSAENLRKVSADLAGVGSGSAGLKGLSDIATRFQDIQKAEDQARSSFDSYMLSVDETDRRVSVLTAFQKKVEDAVAAAQDAHERGTSTPEQEQLLRDAPDILGNIASNVANLKSDSASPLINAAGVVPDLKQANDLTKNLLDQVGGKDAVLNVTAKVDEAKAQIQAVVDGPWVAQITFKSQNIPGSSSPVAASNSFSPPSNILPYMSSGGSAGVSRYNNFTPLTQQEWDQIVPGNSPLADPKVLEQLNSAAQTGGFDPRYLASYLAQEGNFSTAPGTDWQRTNKNPAGLKYANQLGAKEGSWVPFEEQSGGGMNHYAAFNSYGDFFNSMIDTLKGLPGYAAGDPGALAGQWTKGPTGYGALSPGDQQAVANSKLDFYRHYLSLQSSYGVPTYGYSSPSGLDGSGGPADRPAWMNPLGSAQYQITQRPFSGSSHGNLGAYDLAVPTGTPLYAAAGGKVTESGFSNAGYGNSIVIDVGNGTKIRYGHLSDLGGTEVGQTVAAGQQLGLSGNTGNSTGPHLHFEVTVNGKEVDPSKVGFNFDDPSKMGLNLSGVNAYDEFGQPYSTGTAGKGNPAYQPTVGQRNYNDPADPRYKVPSFYDATAQARILAGYQEHLTGADATRLSSAQGQFGQYAQQYYRSQPQFLGNQGAADRVGQQATLNFAIVYAKTLQDAHKAGMDLTQDYEKLREVGGPLAENAIAWLQTQQKINEATDINKAAQEEIKNIQESQFQRGQQREMDDRKIAAAQLTYSRKNEDDDIKRAASQRAADRRTEDDRLKVQAGFRKEQRSIDDATNTENDKYIPISRGFEDRQRKLQFDQQVQQTKLQNDLEDTQKRQRDTVYNRTSQEQVYAGKVQADKTLGAATNDSAILSTMHSSDLKQKDADTKHLDDLRLQIREQTRLDNLASYNLQSEQITAQRTHEDELNRIQKRARTLAINQENEQITEAAIDRQKQRSREDEQLGIEATRLIQKRKDEDAAISLANLRKDEDDYDAKRVDDLQKVIDKNNDLIKSWQDYQTLLDDAANTFRDIAGYAGSSANSVATMIGAAPSGNPVKTPALPSSAKRSFGGAIPIDERNTMVGDAPGGIPTPFSEIISAPGATVTPFKQLMTEAVAQAVASGNGGGGGTINMPITVEGSSDVEETIGRMRRAFNIQVEELRREMNQKNRSRLASLGIKATG